MVVIWEGDPWSSSSSYYGFWGIFKKWELEVYFREIKRKRVQKMKSEEVWENLKFKNMGGWALCCFPWLNCAETEYFYKLGVRFFVSLTWMEMFLLKWYNGCSVFQMWKSENFIIFFHQIWKDIFLAANRTLILLGRMVFFFLILLVFQGPISYIKSGKIWIFKFCYVIILFYLGKL
jgi:hypothetical protein